MEKFSTVTELSRHSVCIEIKPVMADHRFMNQSVLPAVEIMRFLAYWLHDKFPGVDIFSLKDATFSKFLNLPKSGEQNYIHAFIDIMLTDSQDIHASLVSRLKSKSGSMTRSITHASMCFPQQSETMHSATLFDQPDRSKQVFYEVSAEHIYRDLVPFGPSFHNLVGMLKLSGNCVVGKVKSGSADIDQSGYNLLGSCFPLDAAFHAACVWGQRYERIVAFPVGFEERKIMKATCPESVYNIWVCPVKKEANTLFFDIWIYDDSLQVFETVKGVMMKDASSGRMVPPEWIVAHSDI